MATLTPYDTGKRAEPHTWVTSTAGLTATNEDDFGKVDFDNDEGNTVATIWLELNEHSGQYIVHITKHAPLGLRIYEE